MSSLANHIKSIVFILLAWNAHSFNLFCDPTLSWTIECSSNIDCNANPYHFNHSTCTLEMTGETNGDTNQRIYTNASSIFSNPSNYPLQFSIHGTPYGATPKFAILFSISHGWWGSAKATNTLQMYEWMSHDTTEYNYYLDGEHSSTKNTMSFIASGIENIGIQAESSSLTPTTGITFSFAELSTFSTQNPTTSVINPTTSVINPTTSVIDPTTSVINPTTPIPNTSIPTTSIITHDIDTTTPVSSVYTINLTNSQHPVTFIPTTMNPPLYPLIQTTVSTKSPSRGNEAEVAEATTQSNSVFTTDKAIDTDDDTYWIIIVIVICTVCCYLMIVCAIYKVCNTEKRKREEIMKIIQSKHSDQEQEVDPDIELGEMDVEYPSQIETQIVEHEDQATRNGEMKDDEGTVTTKGVDNMHTNVGAVEVQMWLERKVECAEYLSNFIDNGYDTMNIIAEIRDISYLQEIGIDSKEDQLKIMAEIEKMQTAREYNGSATGGDIVIEYDDKTGSMTVR